MTHSWYKTYNPPQAYDEKSCFHTRPDKFWLTNHDIWPFQKDIIWLVFMEIAYQCLISPYRALNSRNVVTQNYCTWNTWQNRMVILLLQNYARICVYIKKNHNCQFTDDKQKCHHLSTPFIKKQTMTLPSLFSYHIFDKHIRHFFF